jgi:hypothetical protein
LYFRQEEIKEKCKKMGTAKTVHLRRQSKAILAKNKDDAAISTAITKILTACGASIAQLRKFVSGSDVSSLLYQLILMPRYRKIRGI